MKILIIGNVGSGISNYSKKMSEILGINRHELELIEYDFVSKTKRNDEEIHRIINNINMSDWIIEGVPNKNMNYLYNMADKIILLDNKYKLKKRNIIFTYIKQKLRIEKTYFKPTLKRLKQMLIYNKRFEYYKKELIINLDKHIEKLQII